MLTDKNEILLAYERDLLRINKWDQKMRIGSFLLLVLCDLPAWVFPMQRAGKILESVLIVIACILFIWFQQWFIPTRHEKLRIEARIRSEWWIDAPQSELEARALKLDIIDALKEE